MSLETIDAKILWPLSFHEVSKWSSQKDGSAGRKFLIARTNVGVVVKGEMTRPVAGTEYRFYGHMKVESGGRFDGQQTFHFDSYEPLFERTASGVADYLARHVGGLGRTRSAALVEHFGDETLSVLRSDPGRAAEVEGIGAVTVELIRRHFDSECPVDPASYASVVDMFSMLPDDCRVPRRVVTAIVKGFGSDAPATLRANPYLILAYPRVGWRTADVFARVVCGYPDDGLERHKAAILEALDRLALDGHTFGSMSQVDGVAFELLGHRLSSSSWVALEHDGEIDCEVDLNSDNLVCSDPDVALPRLAEAERTIARRVNILGPASASFIDAYHLETEVMNKEQRKAARLIIEEPFCLLTGAAGTGKSFLVAQIISALLELRDTPDSRGYRPEDIRIVAPTGKAAKRSKELLDRAIPGHEIVCSTIHRALRPRPSAAPEGVPADDAKVGRGREPFTFAHDEDDPIPCRFLVIDEASLVDVSLMASLLRATPDHCRVVVVGDPYQLPSVGPGSVLRDLIAAGLPNAELVEVQRSAGRVVHACHAIKAGIVPTPSPSLDLAAGENWVHLEVDQPAAILAEIVALHEQVRTMDPRWDMQVITPQRAKHPLSCEPLNAALSALLNPTPPLGGPPGPPQVFAKGDKVVRTRNDVVDGMVEIDDDDSYSEWEWDHRCWRFEEEAVVNGDMGEVLDVVQDGSKALAVVRFRDPDRLCRLPVGDAHLTQAYAMSCHRAQGSGFRYVIIPVHSSFFWDEKNRRGLWDRCWIYTAFSRTETVLLTVGPMSAIRQAVSRVTMHRRRTKLVERLHEMLNPDPEEIDDGPEQAPCGGPEEGREGREGEQAGEGRKDNDTEGSEGDGQDEAAVGAAGEPGLTW